jgi:pimeloyl-ACP methyl ester carboxylesterase
MSTPAVETVPLPAWNFDAKVKVAGTGPPVVYLHSAGGPAWDRFLATLAEHYTVYAPDHPGTGATAREAIHEVSSLWDLVLVYDELLDELGLSSAPVIGSSFGGMIACELAAHRRERVAKLVLLAPIGLWRDDAPVAPYMLMRGPDLPALLFENIDAEPVQELLRLPEDPEELAVALADSVWAMGTTGKFVWPIPDKGLARRLHRITAPTLIVWGDSDRLVSPVYADEFARRIDGSRVEIIPATGHVPQLERLETVASLVTSFLDDGR